MGMETKNAPPVTVDEVELGVLDEMLSFFIRSLSIVVSRDLDEKLGDLEVAKGTGKVSTLLLVDRHPGIRPSVIAQIIMRDRSAMGRLVDLMESQGLLRREVSAEDSRAQELYITPKGAEVAQQVRAIVGPQSEAFFSDLTLKEQRVVIDALRKVYRRKVGFTS
ncbi:MarR family winged helix-turn-helix transcriptional regulator [Rhizobium oryziradicis]|uniref:MarR family transcriptional regulator n=1 Tax=Rhizobium oryziradicis TaxID=1867956 RepID=A0A1Q8ZW61_9HYPH|nr:MarR family transcriptional regulator [Rhizobium oryziradicis]OLP46217.1 MarR family transcriptional regulator [Rhizobium oryziradicis]